MKNNFLKGKNGEKAAAGHLVLKNYSIIDKNWRCPAGEIDIVARQGKYICFIEVKYRNTNSHGSPAEAVDRKKREQLIKLAKYYVAAKDIKETDLRFDVVCVLRDSIRIIENAFGV